MSPLMKRPKIKQTNIANFFSNREHPHPPLADNTPLSATDVVRSVVLSTVTASHSSSTSSEHKLTDAKAPQHEPIETIGSVPSTSTSSSEQVVLTSSAANRTSCHDSGTIHNQYHDIGNMRNALMTVREVENTINSLTPTEKYLYLTQDFQTNANMQFPVTFLDNCNRRFNPDWVRTYPWLVYSQKLDGCFCLPCALFASNRSSKGILANKPFKRWTKVSQTLHDHSKLQYHMNCISNAEEFKHKYEYPEAAIRSMFNAELTTRIQRNRKIVVLITKAILYCGRQCIALRGKHGNLKTNTTNNNPGNFLVLLKLLAENDTLLKEHLNAPEKKNATYLGVRSQNEIIGKDIIQEDILAEIREAKYYSILADEVSFHNVEQMPLCLRFVDKSSCIREEFLAFVKLKRVTGEAIASAIIKELQNWQLNVEDMRGQGYDGASSMSSERIGVQTRIKQIAPLATYTHCSSHCVNLVVASSFTLLVTRNIMDVLKRCFFFFNSSPKREGLLIEVVQHREENAHKKKPLIYMCKTRWVERILAFQHFKDIYLHVVEALDYIVFGNPEETEIYVDYSDWDPITKKDALRVLNAIKNFDFLVAFTCAYRALSVMKGVTIGLQSTSQDICKAYDDVEEVKEEFKVLRSSVDNFASQCFNHASTMAASVGVLLPTKPRTVPRQQHRENIEADTPEEYHRRNLIVPVLDQIISELDARFSKLGVAVRKLVGLVPSVICEKTVDISGAIDLYKDDLPSPDLIDMEIERWKRKFMNVDPSDRPTTLATAIKACDVNFYPNIYELLKISCTIPVTSCECERCCSTLRRLSNYRRATMGQERLSSLALMHIHYGKEMDIEAVVTRFANLHPRKLELVNLVYE